jgi:hypothetical protein
MCGHLPFGGIVADGSSALAEAAVRLHSDRPLWLESQTRGFDLLRTLHSERTHDQLLVAALERASSQLKERRDANLVGQMLRRRGAVVFWFCC